MAGLNIYKASAGSGKTFAITREYIYLLFRDIENYRYILGVTFTNKATAEMKSRIISELDKLSRGEFSEYARSISEMYHFTPALLQQKSALILSRILHDYSHYTILTIDSFFQRVIRAFAREIGFYQGFDIELDQERILTAAVDQMIYDLDANPALREWLVRFAEDKIVEGSTWNINRDIERIGKEIFKENFRELGDSLIDKITDKQFLKEFGRKLERIRREFESEFRQKGQEALSIISGNGLTSDDFKGKSRSICAAFEKHVQQEKYDKYELKRSTRLHHNDIDQWKGKDKTKNIHIEKAYHEGLNRLLGEIIEMYQTRFPVYKTALEVQKHLYVLGVVADLIIHIKDYTSGRNLFMISDTAQFLRKLIQGSDAPFIFEKTGIFVRHFMIDEFQDTSALQWHNFKPLIVNSLAENNENWVVGDVKQSIYRWRNGDWTILSEKIFTDLHPHEITVNTLQYNWRSSRNIIQFNNSFFRNAIDALLVEVMNPQSEEPIPGLDDFEHLLTNAYIDFAQLVPEHKNTEHGYVDIEFIPASKDKEITFNLQAMERVPKIIESLLDHHYDLKDIAILVRTRDEGDNVSTFLLKYQKQQLSSKYRYDVLSNDSLLLKNSEVVRWIISAFQFIADPADELNRTFLIYEYEEYICKQNLTVVSGNSGPQKNLHGVFASRKFSEFLGAFFNRENLKQYPVYELCDSIINYFGLSGLKGELPFLQAFQDMLQEYMKKESVDLNSFLAWWEEHQERKVINMPEGQDAIRLMTLHSAKGLEFKVVIIPFGDWTFMKSGWNSNILWCNTSVEPFNELDLLPVSISKGLENTLFSGDYFREKALSYVDNLNLLYVAFTRAIDALYVIVPESTKDAIENNIGNLIAQVVKMQGFEPSNVSYPAIRLSEYWNEQENRFIYGNLPENKRVHVIDNDISLGDISYIIRPVSDVVKQVLMANDMWTDSQGMLKSKINTGKVMHEIFQRIRTQEDVDSAILAMLLEGKINEADARNLKQQIKELINRKQVRSWFSPGWEIRTEAGILLKDGSMPRPDRVLIRENKAVVVDYKFGEVEQSSYVWQVKNYMQYLRQLEYKEVEGYLWYVNLDKVVPVSVAPEQGKLF